jgi:hypothetical protein
MKTITRCLTAYYDQGDFQQICFSEYEVVNCLDDYELVQRNVT